MAADAVRIDRLVVKRDRVVCDLSLSSECPRTTTPAIAARAVAVLPTLPEHACVNERGDTFGDVIASTPVPHLVEHMVVDLQVRAEEGDLPSAGNARLGGAGSLPGDCESNFSVIDEQAKRTSGAQRSEQLCGSPKGTPPRPSRRTPRTYVGTSEWIDEPSGRARVEVSFADDMVALRAFRDAARIACEIVLP